METGALGTKEEHAELAEMKQWRNDFTVVPVTKRRELPISSLLFCGTFSKIADFPNQFPA